MVAISLYRGNLHRVPDTPRRWLMPTPRISLKDFRILLHRRNKALSLLLPSSSAAAAAPVLTPSQSQPQLGQQSQQDVKPVTPDLLPEPLKLSPIHEVEVDTKETATVTTNPDVEEHEKLNADDENDKRKGNEKLNVDDEKEKTKGSDTQNADDEKEKTKGNDTLNADDEKEKRKGNDEQNADDEKERRRKEVEEKLQVLNAKKHNLVQALKQILNAEEELKRRSSMQANKPPLPLQLDVMNDSVSMTRLATPRAGVESNLGRDMEAGEADDVSAHNPQSRPPLRMSSISPSSESALRRPPYFLHNPASHTPRAAMVPAGSPSRFAPSGNHAPPPNLSTMSVSGASYAMSSPSPAASGGTSGFRDGRHSSPWN